MLREGNKASARKSHPGRQEMGIKPLLIPPGEGKIIGRDELYT
jgi:hypothetical protein